MSISQVSVGSDNEVLGVQFMGEQKLCFTVDLGFAEECDASFLRNVYFPSKIGGKPAWLDLDQIPSTEKLQCTKCGSPKTFLCQVYAPFESNAECFHRTIYLFVCRTADCFASNSAENISAFRSQLARENKFYSAVPPNENEQMDSMEPTCKICTVCGCRGTQTCSVCKNVNYCSKEHQRAHWPQHKFACRTGKKSPSEGLNGVLVTFPEFEIVTETEPTPSDDPDSSDDENVENRRLDDFSKLVNEGKTGTQTEVSSLELHKYVTGDEQNDDISFRKFKERIKAEPTQILRYSLGGEPLWIADVNKTIEVPRCMNCNSERQFEFQIMPQMLNYLKDDNMDWGILAVYTCKNSCSGTNEYVEEFVVKQDIISDNNKKDAEKQ